MDIREGSIGDEASNESEVIENIDFQDATSSAP